MHRKRTIVTLMAALAATGVTASPASAAGERPNTASALGFPPGYLTIDSVSCRFLHHEIDVAPGPGEPYAIAEDARQDVLNRCLRHRLGKVGVGKPGPAGPAGPRGARGRTGAAGIGALDGYTQVTASGTGAVVTVSCPTGDVVLGGGSASETAGSWPSSTSAWSVGRDHLSPHLLSVIATCARSTA